jgi:vitamin B12/bleomycin/antimicrobial peptide transport system ATP-binding/permease protein
MQKQHGFFLQFIKLAGPFWSSRNRFEIRKDTAVLIVLTALQIYMAVLITDWNAALFDALEARSMQQVMVQVGILVLIFIANITITTMHLIVKRRILIGWRLWLTQLVTAKWLDKGRHYQVTFMAKNNHDNPDGRIAEDIRIATEEAIALAHGLFYSVLLMFSFTSILWTLSGRIDLLIGSLQIPIVGYLVWVAVIYSVLASILGWITGKPLTSSTNERQTEEANYRHDLILAQENSLAIALIQGEKKEQERLLKSFNGIIKTYALQTVAWKQIQIFTSGYSVASMGLPILAAAPRYIAGAISLGTLMQAVQSFQQLVAALSWPVNNMAAIAKWRTSVERVLSLVKALDDLDHDISCLNSHQICLTKVDEPRIKFDNVAIAGIDGQVISAVIDHEIKPGERVQIVGRVSTAIKLFHAVADLWPWGSGHIEVPKQDVLFFMPPRPYLPPGTLYDAICYPKTHESFDRDLIKTLLNMAKIGDLAEDLDKVNDWEDLLPLGHQQILGCIRVLLHRPKWLFIQEAFNSLRADAETQILELLAKELPDTAIISITRQPNAEIFYNYKLKV